MHQNRPIVVHFPIGLLCGRRYDGFRRKEERRAGMR